MRILSLSCSRFRSFRELSGWRPGALNVIIGPNASGKSNLLQLIDFLAASAQGRLAKTVQRAGGILPLLWDGEGEDLVFNIECALTDSPSVTGYELRLTRLGAGGDFSLFEKMTDASFPGAESQKLFERVGSYATYYRPEKEEGFPITEGYPLTETVVSYSKSYSREDNPPSGLNQALSSFSVYQDLQTHRDAPIRQPAVTRMEKRVDADGQNLIPVLHTLYTGDREFKNEVNDAMRAAFGPDFEELVFPPASDQRIQLRIRWKSLRREQSAAELSDGTLRFLFLLAVLASPDPAPLIAIDEPETGLHPSMLPIIAEYAVQASKKAQVIFTTHSPALLDAFTETQPQTTVVQRHEGETVLRTLEGPALAEWLEHYTLGKLFESGELEDFG